MSEPEVAARDILAIVQAFNAGMRFDPPAITPSEYRACLIQLGLPLDPDDQKMYGPEFRFPVYVDGEDDEDNTDIPEGED
jgi:hypothetical protein